ncbi:kelch-like protein 28 [Saccostrea echinata]|uniref:kelch-like protein 28 n=1 Tax=Saccostrea echinata TaxID=191078 RepID=UPI002A83C2D8|nr:kelch-like protein 28 [Saccostrea echinata]
MEEDENAVEDPFPEEPGITDIALIVEDREIHTIKAFLMSVSPVLKAMFTSKFREKSEQRIQFPEKKYDDFVLFLKKLHHKEYLELDDKVKRILPLAREYETAQIVKDCEAWMISRLSVKKSKENAFVWRGNRSQDLNYLIEWLTIADDYHLNDLRSNLFDIITKYDFLMSLNYSEAYKHISPETKAEILEKKTVQC